MLPSDIWSYSSEVIRKTISNSDRIILRIIAIYIQSDGILNSLSEILKVKSAG